MITVARIEPSLRLNQLMETTDIQQTVKSVTEPHQTVRNGFDREEATDVTDVAVIARPASAMASVVMATVALSDWPIAKSFGR